MTGSRQGRPSPSETMMHSPLVSDFPLYFRKLFRLYRKLSQFYLFPEECLDFDPPKFLMTFFLVIDHKFRISPLFSLFQYISLPCFPKIIISLYFSKFPPIFP